MAISQKTKVNGQWIRLENTLSDVPLLYLLRNDLKLNGPKYGCGLGECGACTVLIDGVAARSCSIPVSAVHDKAVTTLEGLSTGQKMHPVQEAFVEQQAAQCGYCINGMIMTLAALFERHPDASDDDIKKELAYNLCRCGTHIEILNAASQARALIAERKRQ